MGVRRGRQVRAELPLYATRECLYTNDSSEPCATTIKFIQGTDGDDEIYRAGSESDTLFRDAGADTITGGAGQQH